MKNEAEPASMMAGDFEAAVAEAKRHEVHLCAATHTPPEGAEEES